MSEPETPFWLAWVLPLVAVVGVVAAGAKRLFTSAVRNEMESMHRENQARLTKVENSLIRIEERMRMRWGDQTWGDDP